MSKVKDNLIIKLLLAVAIGVGVGLLVNESIVGIIVTIKHILGQFIFFCVPLIIIGFITPSITELKSNASKMLGSALAIAYLSSVGAALLSTIAGYIIIPSLNIVSDPAGLRTLPELVFQLNISPVMPVMSALVLAIVMGLTIIWTNSKTLENIFLEFHNVMMAVVKRMVIPILPIFIATTFAGLAYEGSITKQFPVFISVILIVIAGHFIWLGVLYGIGGLISKKNPKDVFKHYGPAYLTAVGTMSSAATLPVALECARKSSILDREIVDFTIPICSTIHLCGSVLTETFFVMTVSKLLYGTLPTLSSMITFIILLGIFAVGAPGVPGGTVMASLGLITGVLGFDQSGAALMLTIFALQDSFGTACNITGDGAIALMLTGIYKKKQ
ncbi:dicarboxylate/amino acid:cation symporter [Tissierella sp. MSJ-40]|uniref:Dicarboxylate/amino acid:cation symporter n=1 Tax=Tissierella simiarum TaxID=2841534 RepID=A0ABS6E8K3_9FIRM|nr:dicarboxylate/amino acid:cation symporter [Tissierella simiarum]MBU5439244.1 dicarboxylate/amino acid:cation symporter [Tissierella simiarum]